MILPMEGSRSEIEPAQVKIVGIVRQINTHLNETSVCHKTKPPPNWNYS